MAYFKKRPVVIEAVQFYGKNYKECEKFLQGNFDNSLNYPNVKTINTVITISTGDFIIKDTDGSYCVKNCNDFWKTYEATKDVIRVWEFDNNYSNITYDNFNHFLIDVETTVYDANANAVESVIEELTEINWDKENNKEFELLELECLNDVLYQDVNELLEGCKIKTYLMQKEDYDNLPEFEG